MISKQYHRQVALLLRVLPELSRFSDIALHGGTAINLFMRDMPRLSVDIDLTYLPIQGREESLKRIVEILEMLKARLQNIIPHVQINGPKDTGAEYKLFCHLEGAVVKMEVNTTVRGVIDDAMTRELCEKAQEEFDAYLEVLVVPESQLIGGKIVAALDRQHPRDLFDVKLMLENEGFNKSYLKGLLFGLLSSIRPLHELLDPVMLDQSRVLEDQFTGMSAFAFTYKQYEETRKLLLQKIYKGIGEDEKVLLISFAAGEPEWEVYDFSSFPSVQWKLQNIQKLKAKNSGKFAKQLDALKEIL